MLAAGIAGRSLYEHLAAPAPVIAKQTASVAQSPTQVASSPLPATTLSELPLTPAPPIPADQFRVLLDERFTASSTARDWPSDPHGMSWLTNGGYALAAREPAQFVGVGVPGTDQLQDMVLSASFQKTGGPIGGGYGLIVRDQGPGPRDGRNQLGRFYVFGVGDKGEIGVWLRELDRWVDLLSWTPSEAVRPGTATNELTVSAIGDQLSFLVNSIPVASQLDTVLHGGSVGLFTGGDGNEVAVDRVTVRVPR
jgi:hypothetical protein